MAEPYCFGRFTVNGSERTLCADGVPVPLGPVSFRLLLTLIERAGEVVGKEELIVRLWGNAPMSDNNLQVQVAALRKIIGDETIATKQGRGYRFTPKVERGHAATTATQKSRLGNLPEDEYLPHPIGRAEQIRVATKLLARSHLLTLTGPGGVGKTRLALHLANRSRFRFPDGAWLVELASLKDAVSVFAAIAGTFGAEIADKRDPLEILGRNLAPKKLLIVLDNCEHVVGIAASLSETILTKARDVRIIATSREALGCAGEQVLEIPPLSLPDTTASELETIRKAAAVELLVQRATSADASFRLTEKDAAVVARICRRVDGLPLAIEMVAGWAPVLGLETLEAKLDASIAGWLRATSVAPLRHSTLRATIEWSLDLLSPPEQAVLQRLAVFAGNFTLAAAEAVAVLGDVGGVQAFEIVASLVRKSMVAVVPVSEPQAYRLFETTRAHLAAKLASSEEYVATRLRHARYVLQVIEHAANEWETLSDAEWRARYRPIIDDLRDALDWTTEHAPEIAIALASASWPLWHEFSLYAEGRRRLTSVMALLHGAFDHSLGASPEQEARLRRGIAELSVNTTVKPLHSELDRVVKFYRSTNDSAGLGGTLSLAAFMLCTLDRFADAERAIVEALSLLDPVRDPRTTAKAFNAQMCVLSRLGRSADAKEAGERALALCERVGADRLALTLRTNMIEFALDSGDVDGVIAIGRKMKEELRNRTPSNAVGSALAVLVAALVTRGDTSEALATAREAAPLLRNYGRFFSILDVLALRSGLLGRWMDAALLAGYSDAVHNKSEYSRWPMEVRASERLRDMLRDALPEEEVSRLRRIGTHMSEDEAITLALSG